MDKNFPTIDNLTITQFLQGNPGDQGRADRYIRKRQCQQDAADAIVLATANAPIGLEASAKVSGEFGVELVSGSPELTITGETGTKATYKLVPKPLSELPRVVFAGRLEVMDKLKGGTSKENEVRQDILSEAQSEMQNIKSKTQIFLSTFGQFDCKDYVG